MVLAVVFYHKMSYYITTLTIFVSFCPFDMINMVAIVVNVTFKHIIKMSNYVTATCQLLFQNGSSILGLLVYCHGLHVFSV